MPKIAVFRIILEDVYYDYGDTRESLYKSIQETDYEEIGQDDLVKLKQSIAFLNQTNRDKLILVENLSYRGYSSVIEEAEKLKIRQEKDEANRKKIAAEREAHRLKNEKEKKKKQLAKLKKELGEV